MARRSFFVMSCAGRSDACRTGSDRWGYRIKPVQQFPRPLAGGSGVHYGETEAPLSVAG